MPTLLAVEISNLVNAGLMIEPNVEWVHSATVPYGYVISTTPVGGTQVSQWTYVTILVSLGVGSVAPSSVVPNLVGSQQYFAHQAIGAAGLVWNSDAYAYGTTTASWTADGLFLTMDTTGATADGKFTYPAGIVMAQSVAAGSIVAASSVVQITVSLGAPSVPVVVTVP